jgi:hypothetical protein
MAGFGGDFPIVFIVKTFRNEPTLVCAIVEQTYRFYIGAHCRRWNCCAVVVKMCTEREAADLAFAVIEKIHWKRIVCVANVRLVGVAVLADHVPIDPNKPKRRAHEGAIEVVDSALFREADGTDQFSRELRIGSAGNRECGRVEHLGHIWFARKASVPVHIKSDPARRNSAAAHRREA